jgi:hypothetical protein
MGTANRRVTCVAMPKTTLAIRASWTLTTRAKQSRTMVATKNGRTKCVGANRRARTYDDEEAENEDDEVVDPGISW